MSEESKAKSPVDAIESVRERALKLRTELVPLMKDVPPAGASQKIARRTEAALGLLVELCDVVQHSVLPKLGNERG